MRHFNSIKVRLERLQDKRIQHFRTYFNSIKVRLELRYLRVTGINERFQFHKGAIRTQWSLRSEPRISISIP
mgnify:FL=1